MITVYSNDNAVATDRMCGVRSCAQYSIIFPLLLCTENILLDKKAFKSVYKLIILPWYRRCTWPAAWQCSGQQAAGTSTTGQPVDTGASQGAALAEATLATPSYCDL